MRIDSDRSPRAWHRLRLVTIDVLIAFSIGMVVYALCESGLYQNPLVFFVGVTGAYLFAMAARQGLIGAASS